MSFDWRAGYPSVRLPVFARNVVSTSHPLAAQVGLSLLRRGGNAVDAAIGAAAAMTILEPCSNGLGSDAFCILWDGKKLHGLNASGPAPAAWTPDYFHQKYGADARQPPMRGWDSVTVPGAIAGWVELSRRFGKLSFADLLSPAIEIAERGYAVPLVVQEKWAAAVPELKELPGFADTFMPGGRAPQVGERFVFPGAARALTRIAVTQGKAFYGGEIAAAAARHAAEQGGSMRVADFEAFAPEWVEPIGLDVYGHRLHQIPPNGQGIAALIALGILQDRDLAAHDVDSPAALHLQIEAMKLGFADTYAHVADPPAMRLGGADAGSCISEKARRADRS
jgi:gamma-glutamyltranspeptidase/glutathione hydrolase